MKVDKLALVVGGALIIFVVAYFIMQALKANPGFVSTFGTTKITLTPTQVPNQVGTSNNAPVISNNSSANIIVDLPAKNANVSGVFVVKGKARVFENTVNYRVTDTKSNILIEGSVMAKAKDAGQFGDFSFTISGLTGKGQIILQVFNYSAKDGSEIDKVNIPLNLN